MFLGIDIGTSAVKAVLMDEDGAQLAQASAALGVSSPHSGWSEQDPEDWWAATIQACEILRHQAGPQWASIKSIGLSGQMHGAVTLDAAYQPIRPAILWNDSRSAPQCEALQGALPDIGTLAGVPPMPGFTAPKILWLKQNEPEAYKKIAQILLPKDYVRLRMTGESAMDMADAAGTLWLDQAHRCWSPALCSVSATDLDWLPQLYEGTSVSGLVSTEGATALSVKPGTPVAAGGGDAAAGAVGIGAVEDGDAFLSLGTSGQLFVTTATYRPNPESAIHAYAHCIPERWFQMAAMLNGARPLQWWSETTGIRIETLLEEAQSDQKKDLARTPLFLPYLTGERTPHNDAAIRGGFYGLENDTARAEMTRAVCDAVAYTFCDAQEALKKAGTVLECPAAIGGGARSDMVLQTLSDAMGVAILRRQDASAGPAFGAARLAAIAAGTASLSSIATAPPEDRLFEPNMERAALHQERLAQYRKLYEALAPYAASAFGKNFS